MNRTLFFNHIRRPVFGRLKTSQVEGTEAILDAWERSGLTDARWLAYMLATTFHETARTMKPIEEYGGERYFHRMYDIEGERPHVARRLGNTKPGDGVTFAGRGYVQITGRANYEDMTRRLGVDLVRNPEFALKPEIAARILFEGMTEGTFTGRKLVDYFNDRETDWVNARRIVNGLDRAERIAGYAQHFHLALEAASVPEPPGQSENSKPSPAANAAFFVPGKENLTMTNYSKLIGSALGGVIGIAAAFGIPMEWASPEVQTAVATILGGLIGTFVAPANRAAG